MAPRTLKQSKRHAEVLCRRLVFDRAALRNPLTGEVVHGGSQCEFVWLSPALDAGLHRCQAQATDWAHILPRRYSLVRCEPDNAWALCRQHHELVDKDPVEKTALIRATIGLDRFYQIRDLAYAGLAGIELSPLMFWRGEEESLVALCKAQGLATTHRG